MDMGVSKNRGTSKSWILMGFSIINHPFWGIPIFGNTHMKNNVLTFTSDLGNPIQGISTQMSRVMLHLDSWMQWEVLGGDFQVVLNFTTNWGNDLAQTPPRLVWVMLQSSFPCRLHGGYQGWVVESFAEAGVGKSDSRNRNLLCLLYIALCCPLLPGSLAREVSPKLSV